MTTVLVTGANRGIGLEFTRQYLARGDKVLAACRRPEQADELRALSASGDLEILALDLNDQASMEAFVTELSGRAIDVLINNAGVYGPRHGFGAVQAQDWMAVLHVNSVAPLLLTQLLIDNLRAGELKKLVYITSKMGSIDDNQGGGSYVYRSSKAALNAVVKSIAIDLAPEGFSAAVLHPGWVQTDMGGPNALIDTHTSVTGMIAAIDGLDRSCSGGFFNYDGKTINW